MAKSSEAAGAVVSMALSRADCAEMTLLAFAPGESVSEEEISRRHALSGAGGRNAPSPGEEALLTEGRRAAVPAGVLHAVCGAEECKVRQTTLTD